MWVCRRAPYRPWSCRYCPISLLRGHHHRLVWVIRRFGDDTAFGSPLLRPDAQSAVSRSACPLRRRRAVRRGPVAPTAWDRNPSGRSATSRSTASRVCAANRACASSCSCFVCKEEQARRFRAPGRQMEELGFSDAEIKGREYWDQYIEAFTFAVRSALQPRFSLRSEEHTSELQ